MKRIATLFQGLFLAAGMFLFMGLALGAFGYLREGSMHYHAMVVWMIVLVFIGWAIRRWLWPERSRAWKITATGFLCFMVMQLTLAIFSGEGGRLLAGSVMDLLKGVGMMVWFFIPWFWLPFAIGILAGGFRRKTRHADPSERPTLV